MESYNFDSILYDGTKGVKIARLGLPETCTVVKESLTDRVWRLEYITRKAGGSLIKPEYDKQENIVTTLEVRSLKDYYGMTLPEDPKNPIGRANGREIYNVDAIFTRDKRIYLSKAFKGLILESISGDNRLSLESALKETMRQYISPVFTLDRWIDRFIEHVPRPLFFPKDYTDKDTRFAAIVQETNASRIMKRDMSNEKETVSNSLEVANRVPASPSSSLDQQKGVLSNFVDNLKNRLMNIRRE